MLTIFSTAKAIRHQEDNAIRSWLELRPRPQIIFFCNERGAWPIDVDYQPCNVDPPKVASLFARARKRAIHPVMAYVNADILLGQDCMEIINLVYQALSAFLIVGHRWNVRTTGPTIFSPGWQEGLMRAGQPHRMTGADYFIFPKILHLDIPDFYVGRWAWDNWMILDAVRRGVPVVDATDSLYALHQHHLWAHAKDNPEARHNLAIWESYKPKGDEGTIEDATCRVSKRTESFYTLEEKP